MPKTKKVRKNKRSLKNKVKLIKNKTQKNLKGGFKFDSKIFSIIFLSFISIVKNITSSFDVKELNKNENIIVFSEELKLEEQTEKINFFVINSFNLNIINDEYNKFIEDPNQKAIIPYININQNQFNLKEISIIPDINEKMIESSLSIVNIDNPNVNSLINGFIDIYKFIFMSNVSINSNSITSFTKFILKLIDNKKIQELLNSYSVDKQLDKQLVTLNMKNVDKNFIFLEKMFHVLYDYNIQINSENKKLLNKTYDKIIEFSQNNTHKQIYDNLNKSNINFPSSYDENMLDENIIIKENEKNELKENLKKLGDMINNDKTDDEINDKFIEIQNSFKNNINLMNILKKINENYDDKIVKMNKIINFSVSLCTFLTDCTTIMQLIIYILIVKIFIDLIIVEPVASLSVLALEPAVQETEREPVPAVQETEPVVQEKESESVQETEPVVQETETEPVLQETETEPVVEETETEPVPAVQETEPLVQETESLVQETKEDERDEEKEELTDEQQKQLKKINYDINPNFDESSFDTIMNIFDISMGDDTSMGDNTSINDDKAMSDDTSMSDNKAMSDDTAIDDDTTSKEELFSNEDFTLNEFIDLFPEIPKGTEIKLRNEDITEEEFKKMSETMKKFYEYKKKKKLCELLKKKILDELNGSNKETYKNSSESKKHKNLLSQLNKTTEDDKKIIIDNIKILSDEEKNNFYKEIHNYLLKENKYSSMREYLYNKYTGITENVKKWIDNSYILIENKIELNKWIEKLKNIRLTESDESETTNKIQEIINTLQEKINQSGNQIQKLISEITEKEKNDIREVQNEMNTKIYQNMKNRYIKALTLVKKIESEI